MISKSIHGLKQYLDACFKDYHGLAFKCSSDINSGDEINKPSIYEFLIPSSELTDGFPNVAPCIVIVVDSLDSEGKAHITLHLCVRYDAVSEREKVVHKQTINGTAYYEHVDADEYDTDAELELYKTSLLFNELVLKFISKNVELGISNIDTELPAPVLDDFPYSTSSISLTINPNPFRVGMDNAEGYY